MPKHLNNLNSAYILSCALCFLPFAGGCAQPEPVTKKLHYAVVNANKEPKQFQYYISGSITLKKRDSGSDFEIVDGKIKRHTGKNRDTLYFNSNTPGVLVQVRASSRSGEEGLRYDVRFEDDPDCCLTFGEASLENRRMLNRLYLCYSDPAKLIVTYGGAEYYVERPRGNNPWLIIKGVGKKSSRTVPGAKL
jgi:ribosomal protein L35AE/L33A